MIKIKICGLYTPCHIEIVNVLRPDYIGFVFAPESKRFVTPKKAEDLKQLLNPQIKAVGVFVNESPEIIVRLSDAGIIDMIQLHGDEGEEYIRSLRKITEKPIIKAFSMNTESDIAEVESSPADYVLLDSGRGGTGTVFDWKLIQNIKRPYFLAGGLRMDNVKNAIEMLSPYAVDVSSGIETNGHKDKTKMAEFVAAVRKEDRI